MNGQIFYYLEFQRIFFLIATDGSRREAPREKNNVSGALSNRKHGLFHIRYFGNGPLEPG